MKKQTKKKQSKPKNRVVPVPKVFFIGDCVKTKEYGTGQITAITETVESNEKFTVYTVALAGGGERHFTAKELNFL